jgi:hypothetical protein
MQLIELTVKAEGRYTRGELPEDTVRGISEEIAHHMHAYGFTHVKVDLVAKKAEKEQ